MLVENKLNGIVLALSARGSISGNDDECSKNDDDNVSIASTSSLIAATSDQEETPVAEILQEQICTPDVRQNFAEKNTEVAPVVDPTNNSSLNPSATPFALAKIKCPSPFQRIHILVV